MNPQSGGGAADQRYASVFRPGLYDGKTILVTGGGSGLGRCTAHELAALGASLALVGRKRDKLEATGEAPVSIRKRLGASACMPATFATRPACAARSPMC
ncbi:hypothetical protein ACMZ4X_04071 [Achromobacter marplatensis]